MLHAPRPVVPYVRPVPLPEQVRQLREKVMELFPLAPDTFVEQVIKVVDGHIDMMLRNEAHLHTSASLAMANIVRARIKEGTLTEHLFTGAHPEVTAVVFGEVLYPRIHALHGPRAGKLTGMIIEMDVATLVTVVTQQAEFERFVAEAIDVLDERNIDPVMAHSRSGNLEELRKNVKPAAEGAAADMTLFEPRLHDEGGTPLHIAALMNHVHIIDYLLECGASVTTPDQMGRPPIWWAIERNHRGACEILLDNGSRVLNHQNTTPEQRARVTNNDALADFIRDYFSYGCVLPGGGREEPAP